MKAIFGKLSILCFVVSAVNIAIFFYVTFMLLDPMEDDRTIPPIEILVFPLIFTPLGFLLSIVGKMRKEEPKKYATIGFDLNMIPFILFCLLLVSCVV